jgi:hypothetical protein
VNRDARAALAVHQYCAARARYRQYSNRTRPPDVTAAFVGAKRRLDKVREHQNCESPHLQHSPERCFPCLVPCYYRPPLVLP